mmetsp:Transcript_16655/g.23465  ORF Transcript_16655/g.23465 Transcript_16655/m.23465 type:complete len:522 (+) Transcript_16655:306-1871(+)
MGKKTTMKASDGVSVDESLYVDESVTSAAAMAKKKKKSKKGAKSSQATPPVSPEGSDSMRDEEFDDNESEKAVKAALIPWYKNKRYGLAACLVCFAALLAGAALAFLMGWITDDDSNSGNSSSSSSSNGGNVDVAMFPSSAPSTSEPTTTPSFSPTPLASSNPTDDPSVSPTHAPTMVPSSSPTESPSDSPTQSPIAGTQSPTSTPSDSPTSAPTKAPTDVVYEQFSFYVMGDTPYGQQQGFLLLEQLDELYETYEDALARFTVHVGDFQLPDRSFCAESFYQTFWNYLLNGPLPTFVLAGDNDWFDCPSQQQGINRFLQYFTGTSVDQGGFESEWVIENPLPFEVTRDYANNRPELFYFEYQNVLFFSINILQAAHSRMNRNVDWITEHMERAFESMGASEIRAVIIFGHGNRSPNNRFFFEEIANDIFLETSTLRSIPVVYLHGDGHRWNVDRRLAEQIGWTSQWDITVDRGGAAPPVLVEIAPVIGDALVPFQQENEFQLVIADGLIRIDRQGGRYPV